MGEVRTHQEMTLPDIGQPAASLSNTFLRVITRTYNIPVVTGDENETSPG